MDALLNIFLLLTVAFSNIDGKPLGEYTQLFQVTSQSREEPKNWKNDTRYEIKWTQGKNYCILYCEIKFYVILQARSWRVVSLDIFYKWSSPYSKLKKVLVLVKEVLKTSHHITVLLCKEDFFLLFHNSIKICISNFCLILFMCPWSQNNPGSRSYSGLFPKLAFSGFK